MYIKPSFRVLIFVFAVLARQCVCAGEDSAAILYEAAVQEAKSKFAQALALYEQAAAQYPDNPLSQSGELDFRIKYVQCSLALKNGDIAAARQAADELTSLNISSPQRADFLYAAGHRFEDAGVSCYQDAIRLYQQVAAEYPDYPLSKSGDVNHRICYLQCTTALKNNDIAAARQAANEMSAMDTPFELRLDYLFGIGRQLEDAEFYINDAGTFGDAAELYRQVIAEYSAADNNSPRNVTAAELARLGVARMNVFAAMAVNDINTADAETAKLKADFASCSEYGLSLARIAEKYYEQGVKNVSLSRDMADRFFLASISLTESGLADKTLADNIADASYMLGLNYDQLGDYAKAANAFKNSYQANPKFMYADYLLFAQGYYYEKLLKQGAISASEAKTIIMTQYSQLILTFPQSQYKPYAQLWLKNNSK